MRECKLSQRGHDHGESVVGRQAQEGIESGWAGGFVEESERERKRQAEGEGEAEWERPSGIEAWQDAMDGRTTQFPPNGPHAR